MHYSIYHWGNPGKGWCMQRTTLDITMNSCIFVLLYCNMYIQAGWMWVPFTKHWCQLFIRYQHYCSGRLWLWLLIGGFCLFHCDNATCRTTLTPCKLAMITIGNHFVIRFSGCLHGIRSDWRRSTKRRLPTWRAADIQWSCGCWRSWEASLWPLGRLGVDDKRPWGSPSTHVGRLLHISGVRLKLSICPESFTTRYSFYTLRFYQ